MTPDSAKAVMESHVETWEFEFPATCRVLAAVKDDARDYKPDPKSRTAWELATHLATADIWFIQSVIDGAFAWNPDAARAVESKFSSIADVVEFYKTTFPAKLAEVKELPADRLIRPVDFFGMITWPAVKFLGMATNHSIHHRGQLAAYLRASGSKVPAIYGASADEPMAAAAS